MIPDRQGCKGCDFQFSDWGAWQLRNDVCAEEGPKMGYEVAVPASIGHLRCGLP
jgi:hypothetical protein